MAIKQELHSIYVLKALAAFAVIFIHTSFYFHDSLMPFCRLAVPLFFMISGYFLVDNLGNFQILRIKKSIRHIFKIWVVSSGVYCLYNIIVLYLKYLQVGGHYEIIDILFPDNYFLLLFFENPYHPVLWYLIAYLQTLFVLYYFVKINRINLLLKLLPVFIIMALLIGVYNPIQKIPGFCMRNFIVTGIPFVLFGIFIRRNELGLMRYFLKLKWIFLVTVVILMYIEYFQLYRIGRLSYGDVYVTTVLGAAVFLLYSLQLRNVSGKNILSVIGKKYSLDLYLYHYLSFLTIENFFELLSIGVGNLSFLIAVISTLLFSITLEYCRDRFTILKLLR